MLVCDLKEEKNKENSIARSSRNGQDEVEQSGNRNKYKIVSKEPGNWVSKDYVEKGVKQNTLENMCEYEEGNESDIFVPVNFIALMISDTISECIYFWIQCIATMQFDCRHGVIFTSKIWFRKKIKKKTPAHF